MDLHEVDLNKDGDITDEPKWSNDPKPITAPVSASLSKDRTALYLCGADDIGKQAVKIVNRCSPESLFPGTIIVGRL